MHVLAALAVSRGGRCDSLPMRPAGGSVTRTPAEALGCVGRGDAAALNGPYQATRARSSRRDAVVWWNARKPLHHSTAMTCSRRGCLLPGYPAGSSGGTEQ